MYIEEAKKERFVSFTRVFPNSSQGSDWMPQSGRIIAHNRLAYVALWLAVDIALTRRARGCSSLGRTVDPAGAVERSYLR
jgi:hypothetical protein